MMWSPCESKDHPSLATMPAIEHAIAGIALALGKLDMMVVKTTKSFNIGLMAEAVKSRQI
jgi:hypothetical protein